MYKEFAHTYYSKDKGRYLWNRNVIKEIGELSTSPVERSEFFSVFTFDKSIIEYVKINGSVTAFNGLIYAEVVWIDIDNKEDVEAARALTESIIVSFNQKYNLSPADLFIYFSGNKGFHIAIPAKVFGGLTASKELHERVRMLVQELVGDKAKIDYSIYKAVGVIRKENSKHDESGLYKIQLSFDELRLPLVQIKELAKAARDFKREKSGSSIFVNEALQKEWQSIEAIEISTNQKTQETEHDVGFWKPDGDGNRHNQLFKQAATLFDKSELSKGAIYDIMESINMRCNPPIDDLKETVDAAFKKTRKNVKKSELVIKPFSGWVDEFIDYIFHQSSVMTTGFDSFDLILRKRLKGKLGCIIGYGGSKKSLFALNACIKNIALNDSVAIYSTMEMSAAQLQGRIIDYVSEYNGVNASYQLEQLTVDEARTFLMNEVSPLLGNKLYITQNSSLSSADYDKVIEKIAQQNGRIDMLVVDGLSMMGGSDKETERYSNNTRDLKELANKWNIYIQLICHVSKGAEKHTRDLIEKVRGSEKILDNCDFVITMSQIIDHETSTEETTEYRKDKGYARLYDKRGSGRTQNKIYDFNPFRLALEENNEEPKTYEYKVSRNKSLDEFQI